jgi:predicted HTH transcriptional regulator
MNTPKRIHQYLKDGESDVLDYKQAITSAAKIAKSMVAFANTKGGVLLIGVKDDRKICGVRSEDEKYMLDLSARFYCKPEIFIEIKEWELEGKLILECLVPKGPDQPYYAKSDENNKWWAYIRVKDQSLLASKIVVDVLKRAQSDRGTLIQYSSKEQVILDYLIYNPRITLDEYRKMVNISRQRASKILVNLISAGLIHAHTTEKKEFYTLA